MKTVNPISAIRPRGFMRPKTKSPCLMALLPTCGARILIAAGRVKDFKELSEFNRQGNGMRGMIWERPLQHSIRPKGKDGFLMPYYEVTYRAEQDTTLDVERYTAKAPDE